MDSSDRPQDTTEVRPPEPRKLLRARDGRVIGGVAAGLGRYFNVDPILFRIGAIALSFLGGAGVLLYLAGLLLIPSEPAAGGAQPPAEGRGRNVAVIAVVVVALLIGWPFLLGGGLLVAGLLVPIAALAIAGVLVWWLVSGEGPSGDAPDIARRAALGVAVLVVCLLLAFGAAVAAAAGGGTVIAALVIAAGAAILAGAFMRPVRWLILPAVLVAFSAGSVAAAGVALDGGVGERDYRPTSLSDLRDTYELGVGELDIDLRSVDLPPGDTRLNIDLGVGDARLLVPEDVCVATDADVGMGEVRVLGRESSGVDVTLDEQPLAPAGASRLLLDADVGLGAVQVRDTNDPPFGDDGWGRDFHDGEEGASGNSACVEDRDAS
jgi:phage shock protein PspC (stress-responsive transcriptional regulator)